MASSWDRVGQAASVMQVTGVDAFGLVSMIVQAAHTARRNRDLCQQLAQHVLIVADLLRKLDIPALRQHLETRRPLEQLDAALFRAYKLVRSCAQQQENTSQLYQMFTGAEVASKLRLAQEEIDRYINLIPMITLVAAVGARLAINEVHEDGRNDAAPTQSRLPENRLSLQHVTQSLTLEELQPQGSSIGMEARRNGREATRNAWQVVTENVNNGMFHQMGRYLTYGGTHKSTGTHLLPGGPAIFSYKELCEATRGFSQVEKRGGSFYRGFLHDRGLQVSIKRVLLSSEVERVKIAEVSVVLSQLRHRNIAQLIGWCHEADELLLVYELFKNGSLQDHLYSSVSILTWPMRYKILVGVGDALLYLHKECGTVVVHGNIKPSNVRLESSFNARLGDFGLAGIYDSPYPVVSGMGITMGYTPLEEVMCTNRFTTETDVYSFGVLLLELASGRPPILRGEHEDRVNLVHWLWKLHEKGALLDAVDLRLHGKFDADEMERALIVGLWCVHKDYSVRPSIEKAMDVLRQIFQDPLPHLELHPSIELDCTTSDDEIV